MKRTLLFSILNIFLCSIWAIEKPQLIPYPNHLEMGNGELRIKNNLIIDIPTSMEQEYQVFSQLFADEYSLQLKKGKNAQLQFIKKAQLPQEGYEMVVSDKGINIYYSSHTGSFYAMQTLRQLMRLDGDGYYRIPVCKIADSPHYLWRSFMLDESRHFKGKDFVKTMLDQMAYLKMNRFHWHLTDDQGWRIEIKKYPLLTDVGAWRDSTQIARVPKGDPVSFRLYPHGGFYTQEEIKEIIQYASERHITIIPEIEMPGHASAAVAAYPELSPTQKPMRVSCTFGVLPATYNVADEKVYTFLTDVLSEVIDLFPSKIIHIGGDEVKYDEWLANDKVKALMKKEKFKNASDVQVYFVNRVSNFISSKGFRMMGWNDIMGKDLHGWHNAKAEADVKLSQNTIVHFWKGEPKLLTEAIESGYDVVNSNHWDTYLDYTYERLPLQKAYNFNPTPASISEKHRKHVLGLGCQMWSEYVPTVLDTYRQIFPRIAAYAEVGWTNESEKDYTRFLTALERIKRYWDTKGITYYNENPIPRPDLLIFQDEFDGNEIDFSKWDYRALGKRHDGEMVKEAVSVDNGNLTIKTYSEKQPDGAYKHYTGMISTHNKFDHTFGYYEARIKFSPVSGSWGAFWIQTPTFDTPGWTAEKAGVEIDIIERRAEDKGRNDMSEQIGNALHWMEDGKLKSRSLRAENMNVGVEYHTYAAEWAEDKYIIYYDGKPLHTIPASEVPISKALQYVILSMETRTNSWTGHIPTEGYGDRNTTKSYMMVDYVRVYSRNPYK